MKINKKWKLVEDGTHNNCKIYKLKFNSSDDSESIMFYNDSRRKPDWSVVHCSDDDHNMLIDGLPGPKAALAFALEYLVSKATTVDAKATA